MKVSREEKQQEKIVELQQQLKESRKKITSLKNKLATSEGKRRLLKTAVSKKKAGMEPCLYSLLNGISTVNL